MRKNDDCIAIYSRKSKYTGKGESIGNQIELCKEYIRMHDGEDALNRVIVYEDEGFSGGNLDRPGFRRMMKAASEQKFNQIMVYRLDRISRNIGDFAHLIDDLERDGISFVSISEQFDTGTPMGRAMMYIASVFSQLERETIAERIRDNMHELAKTGRWLGGTTPTGYRSEAIKTITVDGKAKKSCHLALIPEEAETIKTIFHWFMETNSLTVTEARLMKTGIKSKRNHYYSRFAIKSILQNPVYLIADEEAFTYFTKMEADLFSSKEDFNGVNGILAYNRTDQKKGRATIFRPVHEWIISVGKHPGLISGREWVRVQEALERNKVKTYRTPRKNQALLTGIIYCSCGSRMYPKGSRHKQPDGTPVFSYLCKTKEHSQGSLCKNKNINGNLLDAAIIDEIKRMEENQDGFLSRLEKSKRYFSAGQIEQKEALAAQKKELAESEKKMEALIDSLADVPDSAIRKRIMDRINRLSEENESLRKRMEEMETLGKKEEISNTEFDMLKNLLSSFCSSVDHMEIEQKRAAIRALVKKVIWDGTNVRVILFGASEDEIDDAELAVGPENDLSDEKSLLGEDSKSYPITNATFAGEKTRVPQKEGSWVVCGRYQENTVLMGQAIAGEARYAPLCIHEFNPKHTHRVSESYEILHEYGSYQEIENIADRLRWCRTRIGMKQEEVAAFLGIRRATYAGYECGNRNTIPKWTIDRLASLFQIPAEGLLDDYNRFLYDGQENAIRAWKENKELQTKAFAELMETDPQTIIRWERGIKQVSKKSWEKYFSQKTKINGRNLE